MAKNFRKLSITLSVITSVIAGALVMPLQAVAVGSIYEHDSFLERKGEGWFWYIDPKEIEDPGPELQEAPELPPAQIANTENETTKEIEELKPDVFSTAWLRDAMPKYLDLAIDNPSVENVQAYMYLQRLMMDKAERFAFSTQRVVSGDPNLDESVRRPLATFAIQSLDQRAGRNKFELVKNIANDAGLFFFYSSNCEECAIQAPLIKNMQDNYGFAVVPVSVDGKNLPNSPFQEFKTDTGQAQLLDIKKLPAIYLATADGQFELVGQSVYSLPELADRVLFAATRQNLIDKEELDKTRPILDATNIADVLDTFSEPMGKKESDLAKGFTNSEELMQYINAALGATN